MFIKVEHEKSFITSRPGHRSGIQKTLSCHKLIRTVRKVDFQQLSLIPFFLFSSDFAQYFYQKQEFEGTTLPHLTKECHPSVP